MQFTFRGFQGFVFATSVLRAIKSLVFVCGFANQSIIWQNLKITRWKSDKVIKSLLSGINCKQVSPLLLLSAFLKWILLLHGDTSMHAHISDNAEMCYFKWYVTLWICPDSAKVCSNSCPAAESIKNLFIVFSWSCQWFCLQVSWGWMEIGWILSYICIWLFSFACCYLPLPKKEGWHLLTCGS